VRNIFDAAACLPLFLFPPQPSILSGNANLPIGVGFVSCQRQGSPATVDSFRPAVWPSRNRSPPLLRALCAVESSDIRMVQAKVIRTNTYRNALRIRLQLPLESTLTVPLASVENKELTEMLIPLDATLTKNIGGGPVMVNQESDKGFLS